jgi:WNK lysine deficient protein kinase
VLRRAVTEFMQNGNVAKHLSSASLSQLITWARDLVRGMAWLHGQSTPVLHLDLKPENLLIDHKSTLKVGDFGLAKLLRANNTPSAASGTPVYMSPERLEGFPNSESTAADVYAFGMILWQFVTRKRPFEDEPLTVLGMPRACMR